MQLGTSLIPKLEEETHLTNFVCFASMGQESLSTQTQTNCAQTAGIKNRATELAANSTKVLMKTTNHAGPIGSHAIGCILSFEIMYELHYFDFQNFRKKHISKLLRNLNILQQIIFHGGFYFCIFDGNYSYYSLSSILFV